MKRAALSRRRVDRAREVARVVRDDAERPALDPASARHHAEAEVAAELEHRARVGERAHDGADVVHAEAVLGHDAAQHALVGALPVRHAPWK
jgi:hypothetical protein